MSTAGLAAVHHDATQAVLRALHTLLRLGTVGLTVLLNHLTWGRGGEGRGGEGVRGEEDVGEEKGKEEWGLCTEGALG